MTAPTDVRVENTLSRALDAIRVERERTAAERDAFAEFGERVGELSPGVSAGESTSSVRPIAGGGYSSVSSAPARANELEQVRKFYESTVMSVPHYETEYGESYAESVREELGPDVATLLVDGQAFERHHKRAITEATAQSEELRERLVSALDAELDSVAQLRDPVCSVAADARSLESVDLGGEPDQLLDGYRSRLDVLETRCHELIERRQSEMVSARRALSLPISGPDIPTYVYQDLPVNYPVISTLTRLIDTVATTRANVEAQLSCRNSI